MNANTIHIEVFLERFILGNALLNLHRYIDAIASYQQAIEIKPTPIYITQYANALE